MMQTKKSTGSITSNCDGALYNETSLTGFLSCNANCSLSWSCDGVPVFKSSNYAIWPLFCAINELPLSERRRYIILAALWFGNTKPRMDTFLKCFVEEGSDLFHQGVNWKHDGLEMNTKVATLICVCDAPARALVQNFTQFNGAFGCGFCMHEGVVLRKGRGHVRTYPVQSVIPSHRTHDETIHQRDLPQILDNERWA